MRQIGFLKSTGLSLPANEQAQTDQQEMSARNRDEKGGQAEDEGSCNPAWRRKHGAHGR